MNQSHQNGEINCQSELTTDLQGIDKSKPPLMINTEKKMSHVSLFIKVPSGQLLDKIEKSANIFNIKGSVTRYDNLFNIPLVSTHIAYPFYGFTFNYNSQPFLCKLEIYANNVYLLAAFLSTLIQEKGCNIANNIYIKVNIAPGSFTIINKSDKDRSAFNINKQYINKIVYDEILQVLQNERVSTGIGTVRGTIRSSYVIDLDKYDI
jgi:hypothetical protein